MKPSRSTILVLILVGVLTAFQALLGNIVATRLESWLGSWADYVLPTFLGLTGILIGFTVRDQLASDSRRDVQRDDSQAAQNRRAMLRTFRSIWIDGLYKHSLYRETLIALGLHERLDAVVRPLDVLVRLPQQVNKPLPPDTRISEVYDECDGALLLLGAPGAGKTTLLLELVRDLLDRAELDSTHPIPVVFPLSSWAERRLPLVAWLVDELTKRYDVPRKLAQSWVAANTILPLLDGLDEVAPEHQAACVEAINTYRREHGLLPLVVSSRIADYDALSIKLRLHGAILVQPLTREQVKAYLRQVDIHVMPSSTSPWWDFLDTPLMLNIVTLTYAGQDSQILPTVSTPEAQRDHLLTAYIARIFERRPSSPRFPQDRTLRWLRWLAWQMQQRNQTVLYLEHLQPDWLPTRNTHWQYALLDRVGNGLVLGLSYGFVALVVGLSEGLGFGLLVALLVALFGGVGVQPSAKQQGIVQWLWSPLLGALVVGLSFWLSALLLFEGLSHWLYSVLVGGLGIKLLIQPDTSLNYALFVALFGALFGALAGTLAGSPHIRPRQIIAVEALHWSWQNAWRSILTGLSVGLGIGLSVGLGIGLFQGQGGRLIWGLRFGLLSGLAVGRLYGLLLALVLGVVGGLTSSRVERKVGPNQGIRRSGQNAFMVGLVFGVVGGLGFGVLAGLEFGVVVGLRSALVLGLLFGLVGGLANGGYAYLSHAALRLILCLRGAMPLAYVRFLDENAQRILLRKVGGGYIFIHRLLLDYFAKQYKGPETIDVSTVPSVGGRQEQ